MPIRIFCHDSAVIRSRGHNNNAVPNPSSETARTAAIHFSFRFMPISLVPVARLPCPGGHLQAYSVRLEAQVRNAKAARRLKLAQARHRRRERNLGIEQ